MREALSKRGHKLMVRAEYSFDVDFGEAVMHDVVSKVNYGALSAQGDGAAIPEPAPASGVGRNRQARDVATLTVD